MLSVQGPVCSCELHYAYLWRNGNCQSELRILRRNNKPHLLFKKNKIHTLVFSYPKTSVSCLTLIEQSRRKLSQKESGLFELH